MAYSGCESRRRRSAASPRLSRSPSWSAIIPQRRPHRLFRGITCRPMLRYTTAGESHGPGLTAILEGIPSGLGLSQARIDGELSRRQQGYGRGGRMRIETDRAQIVGGVRFGRTIGSPIALWIPNIDHE